MCDPILVTLVKMQLHNSQYSRENGDPIQRHIPTQLRDFKDMITPQFRKLILLFLSLQEVRYVINATLNLTPPVSLNRSVEWQIPHVLEITPFVLFTRKNHLEIVPFISIQDTARPSVGGLIRHIR